MSRCWMVLSIVACLPLGGCFGPNYAQVASDLRAKNLQLERDLATERQQRRDLNATVAVLNEQLDARTPRVASLSRERLAQLFTVGRVEIQKSTDAWDADNDGRPESFRVFVRPLTEDGTVLPATGELRIEAFDLAQEEGTQRIGRWTFGPETLKRQWYSTIGTNHFAMTCPWAERPRHREITFKIRFVDALTGQAFEDQELIKLHLPAAATQKP